MNGNGLTASVTVSIYNRASLLGKATKSDLNQIYKDFKLIVVDDGSTDDTVEFVGNFKDEKIRFISLKKNMEHG